MPKETRLNLRISSDLRGQIERLAEYHGLSLSGLAHSLLVKAVRREVEHLGDALLRGGGKRHGVLATEITVTQEGHKRRAG